MFLVNVYLDRSPLEGIGVFAKHAIAKGTLVWQFDGRFDRLIPNEVWESTTGPVKDYLDRYSYPSRQNPGHIVFEADDARYMNHADSPNCDIADEKAVYALRDIAAREELTCDYNHFFGDAGFEMLGER
ncbi:MAG: SET domain-containing protein-lysine N-methyltransferase [Rhizobiaceae bacterium]|nr:SET domain-containing protein-lysine N-methyltransferase [Rhizobiaceae bacterium]